MIIAIPTSGKLEVVQTRLHISVLIMKKKRNQVNLVTCDLGKEEVSFCVTPILSNKINLIVFH